jgi:hypothetical protein
MRIHPNGAVVDQSSNTPFQIKNIIAQIVIILAIAIAIYV